jgi:hypothetical protein
VNYLAHGRDHVDEPWVLAGTALPDWLRLLPGRVRLPEATAHALAGDPDPRHAGLARGVVRHHEEDRRFHTAPAFRAARTEVARALAGVLPAEPRHRPSFVAHLLAEMLLDAALAEQRPGLLDDYYAALDTVDPAVVEAWARTATGTPCDGLAALVLRFRRARFLADYARDEGLLYRVNQVLGRVRQPALPGDVLAVLPAARALLRRSLPDLLPPRKPSA